MLPCQDCRRHQQRALLSIHHAFEGGAQRDLCLSKADIAAQQPVHRYGRLHIGFDLIDTAQLIVRFVVGKAAFEVVLPIGVRRKRVSLDRHTLRVQLGQLLGHILNGLFHALARLLPLNRIELAKAHVRIVAHTDIFAHQIKLRHRHEQRIRTRVAYFDIILDNALDIAFNNPLEHADAVGRVHNIIARGQIADVAQLLALFGPRLAPARLRDGLCLRDDGKLDIGVLHAGAHTGRHHAHAAGL